MDMLKLIQQMTDIENQEKTKKLNESAVAECGETAMAAPSNPGNPVTMSVTLNASGKEHVDDLLQMMKAAGLEKAAPAGPEMMPMRQDMDRLGDIMRKSEMGEEDLDEYDNEPEETYMIQPKGGGINREKGAYLDAEDGDNAMAVESDDEDDDDEDEMRESIKSKLLKSLSEKKAKPDYLDMDKDGDRKEPMKKAISDKKKKEPVKEASDDDEIRTINTRSAPNPYMAKQWKDDSELRSQQAIERYPDFFDDEHMKKVKEVINIIDPLFIKNDIYVNHRVGTRSTGPYTTIKLTHVEWTNKIRGKSKAKEQLLMKPLREKNVKMIRPKSGPHLLFRVF